MPDPNLPILQSTIHLPPDLLRSVAPEQQAVCAAVTKAADALLVSLGIPGCAEVTIQEAPDQSPFAVVNGYTHHWEPSLVRRSYSLFTGRPPAPQGDLEAAGRWLAAEADTAQMGAFLQDLWSAGVRRRPAHLLGPGQVATYRQKLSESAPAGAAGAWQDDGFLTTVLQEALDAHISLADHTLVADAIATALAESPSAWNAAQALIDALAADYVEILVPRPLLRALTLADASVNLEPFVEMRNALFFDLGIGLPPFRFVPADDVPPHAFAFRINDMSTPPWTSLGAGDLLVSAHPDELAEVDLQAQPVLHPNLPSVASLVSRDDLPASAAVALTTWEPLEYLALCMAHELRAARRCLVHAGSVDTLLNSLSSLYPALVASVQQQFTGRQLTAALRHLVGNGISLFDLRTILEQMLDADYVVVDTPDLAVFDSRRPLPKDPGAQWRDDPLNIAGYVEWHLDRLQRELAHGEPELPPTFHSPGAIYPAEEASVDEMAVDLIQRFSREQVRDLFVQLWITQGANFESLTEETGELISEFLVEIGYDAADSLANNLKKLTRYFEERPLEPALVRETITISQGEIAAGRDAYVTRRISKYARPAHFKS